MGGKGSEAWAEDVSVEAIGTIVWIARARMAECKDFMV
jgi:hypothetical protein